MIDIQNRIKSNEEYQNSFYRESLIETWNTEAYNSLKDDNGYDQKGNNDHDEESGESEPLNHTRFLDTFNRASIEISSTAQSAVNTFQTEIVDNSFIGFNNEDNDHRRDQPGRNYEYYENGTRILTAGSII